MRGICQIGVRARTGPNSNIRPEAGERVFMWD